MRRRALSIAAAALALVAAVGAAQQTPAKNDSAQAAASAVAAGNQGTANGKTLSAIDRASLDPTAEAQARAAELAKDPVFSEQRALSAAAQHEAEARRLTEAAEAKKDSSLQEMLSQDSSLMKLAGIGPQDSGQAQEPIAKYRLFVSRSMGDEQLRDIMEMARDQPDMVVVFRGLLPKEKVNQLGAYLMRIAPHRDGEPMPNVVLDPTVFSASNVTEVPTLQRLDDEGNVLATVRGLATPKWLDEQVERGQRGDLGKRGSVVAVSEEDAIVMMKRALASYDMDGAAMRGLEKFWTSAPQYPLPKATADSARSVDPSVVLNDDMVGPDGTVLARAGDRINPMDAMPFDMTVVVIDATDPIQLEFARLLVAKLGSSPVTVMTTGMSKDNGWQAYQDAVVNVGVPIYMVDPDIIERFGLQKVPSVVTGGNNRMLAVREYALKPNR